MKSRIVDYRDRVILIARDRKEKFELSLPIRIRRLLKIDNTKKVLQDIVHVLGSKGAMRIFRFSLSIELSNIRYTA